MNVVQHTYSQVTMLIKSFNFSDLRLSAVVPTAARDPQITTKRQATIAITFIAPHKDVYVYSLKKKTHV